MSSSASMRTAARREELANIVSKSKTVTKAKVEDSQFAAIKTNAFYEIAFDTSLNERQKVDAMTKALTAEGTKEEMRARIAAYDLFQEWLAAQRSEMAERIIGLVNTDTFAELKQTYDDMYNDLLAFDEKMKPLTDIIDAVYTLRKDGKTFDAMEEIKQDRERDEKIKNQLNELYSEVDKASSVIDTLEDDNIRLGTQRSFFGLGGVKAEALAQIEVNKKKMQEHEAIMEAHRDKMAELEASKKNGTTSLEGYEKEKARLRDLLDISSDQHRERQKDLVQSALTFIQTSKERIGTARDHLMMMDGQLQRMKDGNDTMSTVVAIMDEGIKGATVKNSEIRTEFTTAPEGEGAIDRLTRERRLAEIDQHVQSLQGSEFTTAQAMAELTTQSARILTMRNSNTEQLQKARILHSQGIAGMADRLSTVLNAVSASATGEAHAGAAQIVQRMNENTNTIAHKESMRVAYGIQDLNDELQMAMDNLQEYGEVTRASTDITREGIRDLREKINAIGDMARQVKEDVRSNEAVAAETAAGVQGAGRTSSSNSDSPFA